MTKWLESSGTDDDIVVSTRIRLARNIDKYKFPNLIDDVEAESITQDILKALEETGEDYKLYRNINLSELERNAFVEKHIISPNLAGNIKNGSFLIRKDQRSTIMINEEDHIRIQVLFPGLNLGEAWDLCSDIDDKLENSIRYAFHEKFGYLTSCPTNVGTGLRASVMLHLPGLSMSGQLNNLVEGLRSIGITVRGLYGEGSKALGNLYQISNQITTGEKEEDLIRKINKFIQQIIKRERNTRTYLFDKKGIELEDKIFRSLGILNYSRVMSSLEAMNHLSNVKFGIDMGIIKDIESKEVVKLMLDIQPASIKMDQEDNIENKEIDILRGEKLRKKLKSWEE